MPNLNQRLGWKPTVLVLGAVLVLAGGLLFTLPLLLETGTAHAQESGPYDYAYNSMGATVPTTTWYLPLSDGQGDEAWLIVHNPGASAVEFDVNLMTASGPVAGPQDQSLAAYSRYTVSVDVYTSGQVSAEVVATGAVICESMVFGNDRTWSYGSVGATASATSWYFADGCSAWGFETFVVIQNPNATAVETTTTFLKPSGSSTSYYTVPAKSCYVLDASKVAPDSEFSIKVTASETVVCQRVMYGNGRSFAHATIGSTNPATTWYFAEGYGSGDCNTWLMVQNPGDTEVTAHLSFMSEAGTVTSADYVVTAHSRTTINLGMYVIGCFSTKVVATGVVVCERVMYASDFAWGHCSMGTNFSSNAWYFADGYTGSAYETDVLIQNPNTSAVNVTLTFMKPTGNTQTNIVIPAQSRYTVSVNQAAPYANVSTKVEADLGVVCERSMYHLAPVPYISTALPASGKIGTLVTISGGNFGATRGTSKVNFGSVTATYYASWSDSQIVCKVPAGSAASVNLKVTTAEGTSNSVTFNVLPFMSSISPTSAVISTVVTINGSGFGATRGASYVKFGGVKVTNYKSWSATQILVWMPGAASGAINLSVTTPGGRSNLVPFKVIPRIIERSPAGGTPGTQVTLNGTGFGDKRGTSTVKFGTTPVTRYIYWSNNQIVCKVPATGTGAKLIKVTTPGGTSAGVSFTVR